MPKEENNVVHTDVDLIIELVREKKEISVEEVADTLNLPIKTVEELADYLDEEGIISIEYRLTTEFLIYKNAKAESAKIKGEEETIENMFNNLDKVFLEAMDFMNKGDFNRAKQEYKEVNEKIKKIHREIKKDAKDLPSLESMDFVIRIENVEHLLDHIDLLISKKEEKRVKSTFKRINKEVKSIFADIKQVYNDFSKEASDDIQKNSKIREELLKRLNGEEDKEVKEEKLDNEDKTDTEEKEEKKKEFSTPEINDFDNKDIDKLVDKAREYIKKGRLDYAKKLYEKIKSINNNLYNEYKKKHKILDKEVIDLKEVLSNKAFEIRIEKLKGYEKRIEELMDKFKNSIDIKKVELAKHNYEDLIGYYHNVPDSYFDIKIKYERKILKCHNELLSLEEEVYNLKISEAEKEVNLLIEQGKTEIEKGNIKKAIEIYKKIKEIYNKLPQGYLPLKLNLQEEIFSYYLLLMHNYKDDQSHIFSMIHEKIRIKIENLKNNMALNNINKSEKILKEIEELLRKLPNTHEKKREIEKGIIQLTSELITKKQEERIKRFNKIKSIINIELRKIDELLKENQPEAANNIYKNTINTYHTLPRGFILEKQDILKNMLYRYKIIIIKLDQPHIKDNNIEAYERLLKAIMESREAIIKENFDSLQLRYKQIVSLYNSLPIGILKKKIHIRNEILKIYDEKKIVELINEIDNLIKSKDKIKLENKIHKLITIYKETKNDIIDDDNFKEFIEHKINNTLNFLKTNKEEQYSKGYLHATELIISRNRKELVSFLRHTEDKFTKKIIEILKETDKSSRARLIRYLSILYNHKDYSTIKELYNAYYAKIKNNEIELREILIRLTEKYPEIHI